MANLQKSTTTGNLLKTAAGDLANGCPAGNPCTDCNGSQPDAVITGGSSGVKPSCDTPVDNYTYNGYTLQTTYCVWRWIGDVNGLLLDVYYTWATGEWCATINALYGNDDYDCVGISPATDVSAGTLACDGSGDITGHFTLIGGHGIFGGVGCSLYSILVSLNGG